MVLDVCGNDKTFLLRDGSTLTLDVVPQLFLGDVCEVCPGLNVYQNNCYYCTFSPLEPLRECVPRSPAVAFQHWTNMRATAEHGAWGHKGEVARQAQGSGFHYFMRDGVQAHVAAMTGNDVNLFEVARTVAHATELGIFLRALQHIAIAVLELDKSGTACPEGYKTVLEALDQRIAKLSEQRSSFAGVRVPDKAATKICKRTSLTATEIISIAPLLLLAVRDIPQLNAHASDLAACLRVISFVYSRTPRRSELAVWTTELQRLYKDVLSQPRFAAAITLERGAAEKSKKERKKDKAQRRKVATPKKPAAAAAAAAEGAAEGAMFTFICFLYSVFFIGSHTRSL